MRTVPDFAKAKAEGRRIVSLTAYDFPTALLEQEAGIDFILVGDSIAMAVLGEETTLGATVEMMLPHVRAVRRGAPGTFMVADMPFGSYQASDERAVDSAVRFIAEGGADAVKLEGGAPMPLSRTAAIIASGIPVMGHVGLLPQSVRASGGYRAVGADQAGRVMSEARALEEAGVFAIVMESVEEAIARDVTGALSIPTIGIGAGRHTDGQILVVNDMLGITRGFEPRFLKRYADMGAGIALALAEYAGEVRNGSFPEARHAYAPLPESGK
jgi:3-methyl-2-oxobutanoate hydroxymethyltransferase